KALAPIVGPNGAGTVERIAAALSRPRQVPASWADSSGSISRLDPAPHRTNVSWSGHARGNTGRMALGAALATATVVLIGILAFAVHRGAATPPLPPPVATAPPIVEAPVAVPEVSTPVATAAPPPTASAVDPESQPPPTDTAAPSASSSSYPRP